MSDRSENKHFSVTLTVAFVEALDRLIEEGIYLDHQDAICAALRHLFQIYGIEQFSENKEPASPSEQ